MMIVLWEVGCDVVSEVSEFAYEGAGDGGEGGVGDEEYGVDAGELTVDVGHLLFVLEILDGSYAAQDGSSADGTGEIGGETGVLFHTHARFVFIKVFDGLKAFLHSHPAGLLLVDADGYNDLVKEVEGACDEVCMPDGEGVEGAGEEEGEHGG